MPVATAEPIDSLNEDLKHVEEWWNRERRPLMTQDRQGHLHPPEEQYISHIMMIAIGAILGLISAAAGHKMNWDVAGIAGFFLFPVLISLPGGLLYQRAEQRFKAYEKLKAEYEARRAAIMERHARRA